MSQISYRQLLSACLSAARDCSVVIRNTYAEGGNKVYLNKSTDPNVIDPQTQADLGAQYIIQTGIQKLFPNLSIVGEEDTNLNWFVEKFQPPKPKPLITSYFDQNLNESTNSLHTSCHQQDFNTNINHIQQMKIPSELELLDNDNLVVFIDPLDGTNDYTKGRVENVTTLIGISYHGHALGGIIYYPFGEACVYGGIGFGVYSEQLILAQTPPSQYTIIKNHPFFNTFCQDSLLDDTFCNQKPLIFNHLSNNDMIARQPSSTQKLFQIPFEETTFSHSLEKPTYSPCILRIVTTSSHFSPDIYDKFTSLGITSNDIIRAGGAGNKGIFVLTGAAVSYIYPRNGTKRWDILALDACITAYGGYVTDIYGKSYVYNQATPEELNKAKELEKIAEEKSSGDETSPYANIDGCVMSLQSHKSFIFPLKSQHKI